MKLVSFLLGIMFLLLSGCNIDHISEENFVTMDDIPSYCGEPFIVIEDNDPDFSKQDYTQQSFENYSELDELGRCGIAYANVGLDTMPTEKRGSISQVKPTGWQSIQYDFVDGKSLYNRCHLIGWQLTAENANKQNLITGTRYLNVDGMLPFENQVAEYIKETSNHVLYRVTPDFKEDELVARGVRIEAESVEDKGKGLKFDVYVYNVQPGVEIDYATGDSWIADEIRPDGKAEYILNISSKKFHVPSCSATQKISEKNFKRFEGDRKDLMKDGYIPCSQCNP